MSRITIAALVLLLFICSTPLHAQKTFPTNGVLDHKAGHYAFTNATIFKAYDQKLEKATLIIKAGKVEACGTNIRIPKSATVIDLGGKYIYPSFIDIYTSYGLPEATAVGEAPKKKPQMLSNKPGAYSWNEALRSEFSAHEVFAVDTKAAKAYRDQGFGVVLTHQMNGISRGSSSMVLTGEEKAHGMLLKEQAAHHLSFSKGKSTQNYPSSLMGTIALLRQTYLDGQWYKRQGHQEEVNLSLQAWNDLQNLPQIFEVRDKLDALRAQKIGKEFNTQYIFFGKGDEYQRLDVFASKSTRFILSLNFPKAYDLEDPFDALQVSLSELKHWELAPSNPARLAKASIPFVLTTHGLKKKSDFHKNLRLAIQHGLTEQNALQALTATPAQWLGVYDKVGSLENGKLANFIISSANIFDEKSSIHHHWINGKAYVVNPLEVPGPEGTYNLSVGDSTYSLQLMLENDKPKMAIHSKDSTTIKVKHTFANKLITLSFNLTDDDTKVTRLSGSVADDQWLGNGTTADGQWVSWSAKYSDPLPQQEASKKEASPSSPTEETGPVIYPFAPFGLENRPVSQTYIIQNTTVWTNESAGILKNTDVLVQNGKIAAIGSALSADNAIRIDGRDKHLTCGIIDEHSHIAISRGVNEGTQASSAEVRIGDVINSEDVNIYRNLSGGVTTSQLLHGSANPIGGQSALIKLRWGVTPEQMKFEGADGFIKFALGENVKQTNWGDVYSIRFPQTRMGVEQVYDDYFTRAAAYKNHKPSGKPYRKDLDLEAVLEVLEKKRFITCHSYQQGEINMLMKVAERHGFVVNTFTHILEGYKVADKMAAHGAGGSTFSDWWAYKYEVIDAIPHNGALMHEQGVLTAFNSDDAEMSRRLNQEAAKAVLFGGLSEEEAWKFVTLNPAKLLHIDHRVGSIKVGKDADLVLWSDHPMSVYTKAEMTWIDGIKYFDRAENEQRQIAIQEERNRLIQKSLAAKKAGAPTQKVRAKKEKHYHCDDIEDEGY